MGATLAHYSRSQENEADRLGQGIAALAGYDPAGMASFLKDLEFTERLELGASRRVRFFDTHPATRQRSATAAQRARGIAWKPRDGIARDREEYLRRLDGMVVGTSAAEGVFRGGRFIHPDLGFTIRFPDGWETRNTRQAVGAIARDRSAQVVLEHHGTGHDLEKALAEFAEEAKEDGLRIERTEAIQVGGSEALRAHARVSTRFGGLAVLLTFIESDGHVYRITGVSRGDHDTHRAVFMNVARSFRPVPSEVRGSVQETRLRLAEARTGESLARLSARTGNQWPLQKTAVMNDVFATDALEPGQLVKVAIAQPYQPAED
jgi:predicted Zn-dependent protease